MTSIEPAEWDDPRVAALHTALFAETGALYKDWLDALTPDALAAARGSLAIDPVVVEVTLIVLDGDTPVGTGAIRRATQSGESEWEVKRVYVADDYRGRGLSRALMDDLEVRAVSQGAKTMVLQTGALQLAAHGLYESMGYERADVYPPYGFFPGERFYRKTL